MITMTEFILYGGKGGVGKTTCASATGYGLAENGYRTLIISTDPAHSIEDVFEKEIGSKPTKVDSNRPLYSMEVDPQERFDENYSDTFNALTNELESLGIDITDDVDIDTEGIVGSDELAVVDLFSEYIGNDEWDYVVFDTAPTGHTLRMIRLPEVLDGAFGKAIQVKSKVKSVSDKVTGVFGDDEEEKGIDDVDFDGTQSKIKQVADVLQDGDKTEFRAVMEAEELSMKETKRLLEQLDEYNISIDRVVINKVLTDIDESCNLCVQRKESQSTVIQNSERMFDSPVSKVPLIPNPSGDDTLRTVAKNLGNLDSLE